MVDLSKHIARAKQGLDRRNYDLVFEVVEQCVDVDPTQLDVHRILIDAAKRKFKEKGAPSFLGTMSMPAMTNDPQKQFVNAIKRIIKGFDPKHLVEAGLAASKCATTVKAMADVAIFYFEEQRASGLFHEKGLIALGTMYAERYRTTKVNDDLDRAIKCLREVERAMPNHPDVSTKIKNWEALRSIDNRGQAAGGDYRSQLAGDDKARRAEVMNRQIRTLEDAREVLVFLDADVAAAPDDKHVWLKKGDIHRRIGELEAAREAFHKAQALDSADFTITMRLGEIVIEEAKRAVQQLEAAKQDPAAAKKNLLQVEIAEYRKRTERQPTDMLHRYNLGLRLIQMHDIDGAAAEFQKSVSDPKLRRGSHRYLGYCFTKKNLLDLAQQQYTSYLALVDDDQSDEAKEVRYLRARVCDDLGKKAEAITDYERLVALDMAYKDAATRLNQVRQS